MFKIKKYFLTNVLVLISFILLGILLYYFLDINMGKTMVDNSLEFGEIFSHNILYFFIAFLGFLTLGVANVLLLIINGLIIGFYIGNSIHNDQFIFTMLNLLPHGVFELLALLIASTYSFYMISYSYNLLFKKEKISHNIGKITGFTAILILTLTILAAIIEINVHF
ncbi:stage II sporulation protein M [Staphylococcus caprae]|uniref:stage II sporulation protein M n=1 Tax=Staphylococcus caprae TaxID=29380 RepID=UPI003B210CCE